MGKFYYCGILTVRRQSKNPRKSLKRKFNLLLGDVLFFVILISTYDIIIEKLKAELILRFLYIIHIYMLKILCRMSHFLTEWSFRAKVFCAPGSKNILR